MNEQNFCTLKNTLKYKHTLGGPGSSEFGVDLPVALWATLGAVAAPAVQHLKDFRNPRANI